MNAGFSTLKLLKEHLLPEALRTVTDYDTVLTALGLGVAAQFEQFCNRKFYRTAGDTVEFTAARLGYVVPRYPLEAVSAIAIKNTAATGYVTQDTSLILNWNAASGLVNFGGTLGGESDLVKLTYTGGYWWNTNESATDTMPTGATALPNDIQVAWFLQCAAQWDKRDKLGNGLGSNPDVKQKLDSYELLVGVKQMLIPHIRWQAT